VCFVDFFLNQHDETFLFRDRIVHHALRHDVHVTGVQLDRFVVHLNLESPLEHVKKLVLKFVVVPRKLAFYFRDLDIRIIEFANDARRPQFVKFRCDLRWGCNRVANL
jgi:hypothetical protein